MCVHMHSHTQLRQFDIWYFVAYVVNNILNLIKFSGQSHWERESARVRESEKGIKLIFICKIQFGIVTHTLAAVCVQFVATSNS